MGQIPAALSDAPSWLVVAIGNYAMTASAEGRPGPANTHRARFSESLVRID
jgi:hypothetical protein